MNTICYRFPARLALAAALAATLVLAGCSKVAVPGVYRIDVQQGNVVTTDMIRRLEPGMTRRKVRFVLGTPLIADTFNADRWDYLYTYQEGHGERVQRRISVIFEKDVLARIDGDIEAAARRQAPTPRQDKVVDVVGPREPDGILAVLNPFDDDPNNEPSLFDSISFSEKKPGIRRIEDVEAEAARAAANQAAAANADAEASTPPQLPATGSEDATVRALPADPDDVGQPISPPVSADVVRDGETAGSGSESAGSASTGQAGGGASPSAEQPLPTAEDDNGEANASAAADSPEEEEGATMFDRIREQFKLPDTGFVQPPAEEDLDGAR